MLLVASAVPACEDLTEPANGNVEYDPGDGFHFNGTSATYSCDDGFRLGSPDSATCELNAAGNAADWSTIDTPACELIVCDIADLTEVGSGNRIENGEVDVPIPSPTLRAGHVATYSCDDNFVLYGNSMRTCLINSSWSGSIPTCACPEPMNQYLPKNCSLCSEVFGVNCKECDNDKCTRCANGDPPEDGKCESGSGSSGGDDCGVGCIIGIIIAAIVAAILLALLIAAIIYGIYKYKSRPNTKLQEAEGAGTGGVAKDNPLYVDPATVESET